MNSKVITGRAIIIVLSILFSGFTTFAQNEKTVSVERFEALPNDLSAQNNQVKDFKGKAGALLKVLSKDEISGVNTPTIGAISKKGHETWINLPAGTQEIELEFPSHAPLKLSFSDFNLTKATPKTTYLLILSDETGLPVIKNTDEGNEYFQEGLNYYYGLSGKLDMKKARQSFLKAAEQGNPEAQYYLGMMYLNAVSIDKDPKLAYEWLSAASRRDDPEAMLELARIYQDNKSPKYDDQMAFAFFNKSADAGNPVAKAEVGYYYDNGLYVAKDTEKALQLFQEAAKQGNPMGLYNLGMKYYKGDGIAQNKAKAFECFVKAAKLGDPYAQYNVGAMYERGIAVSQDMEKALKYYRQSAAQGNDKAISALILLGVD